MNIRCPQCQYHACGFFDRACPQCGFPLTLGSLLKFYAARVRVWLRPLSLMQCPHCREAIPLTAKVCPDCGRTPTMQAIMHASVAPARKRLEKWEKAYAQASPQTKKRIKRRIQWPYLLLSLGLLWWLLAYVEQHAGMRWYGWAALSIIHLAALGFFAAWLFPRPLLRTIWTASGMMKLSLALNVFSGILLLQLCIGAWQEGAQMLATLFAVVWLSAFLLVGYVWPMAGFTVFLRQACVTGFHLRR